MYSSTLWPILLPSPPTGQTGIGGIAPSPNPAPPSPLQPVPQDIEWQAQVRSPNATAYVPWNVTEEQTRDFFRIIIVNETPQFPLPF